MAAANDITMHGDVVLRRVRQETADAQVRAEREMEFTRAKWIVEIERAQCQVTAELEHARTAESRLKEVEAKLRETEMELFSHQSRLHTVTLMVRGAEERAENAKEIARMAEARVAKMVVAARATKEKAAVAKAVGRYRSSEPFLDDMAEASTEVYLQDFLDCKEKVVRVSGIAGLNDLEPDDYEEPEVSPAA